MKAYLNKSGLTAVILITIGAIVFLPKQAAQWTILASVLLWGIVNGILFCLNHKDFFRTKSFKKVAVRNEQHKNNAQGTSVDFRVAVIQLAHRITDKMHSAFPEGTWQWTDKPNAKLFTDGGRIRIATVNTGEFNEADIFVDSIGRIDIKMLKSNRINDIISAESENAETDFTVDPKVWYEQRGKSMLTELITDLNARGTKSISIDEKGNVTLENSQQVATLEAFPTKNLWKQLISLFEADDLKSTETDDSIMLSW